MSTILNIAGTSRPTFTVPGQVIANTVKLLTGAGVGKALLSDSDGDGIWTDIDKNYFPTGIEFGSTTQEYDITGTTWVSAEAGGTLGGIPDNDIANHTLANAIAAVSTSRDGTNLTVRELTGAASATNPLTVQFLFSGVIDFNSIELRSYYHGSASHIMYLQLWNFTSNAWDTYYTFAGETGFTSRSETIFNPSLYISAGVVKIQFIHASSGLATHYLEFDYVSLRLGGGGGGSIATASAVLVTPTGGIAATNVQTALAELDTEKASLNCGDATFGLLDTNASHYLRLDAGSDLSADRILSFVTGDAARTITLSGNPTLNDWFDQSVKAAATPTFAGLNLTENCVLTWEGGANADPTLTHSAYNLDLVGANLTVPYLTVRSAAASGVMCLKNASTNPGSGVTIGIINAEVNNGYAAAIYFVTDAATGTDDLPGRISFWTTPDGSSSLSERMRITQAGRVGIASSVPVGVLDSSNGFGPYFSAVSVNALCVGSGQNIEATLNINQYGYNDGATQFRNLVIYNGKNTALVTVAGSTGAVGIGTTTPTLRTSTSGYDTKLVIQTTAADSSYPAVCIIGNSTTDAPIGDVAFYNEAKASTDSRIGVLRFSRVGANNSSTFFLYTQNAGTWVAALSITAPGTATFVGTVNATTINATTIQADHIGEKTGSHTVIFDNTIYVNASRSYFCANSEPWAVGARYNNSCGTVYFGGTNSAGPDAQISNASGTAIATFYNGGGMLCGAYIGSTSNGLYRSVNDDGIFISGGSGVGSGAYIMLLGGAHVSGPYMALRGSQIICTNQAATANLFYHNGSDFYVSTGNILTAYYNMSGTYASTGTPVIHHSNGYFYNLSSSERFKDSIRSWTSEKFMDLLLVEPIKFRYKVDKPDQEIKVNPDVIGFSAEDLHNAGFTDLINYDNDSLPYSLRDQGFLAYYHRILQNLNNRVKALEKK